MSTLKIGVKLTKRCSLYLQHGLLKQLHIYIFLCVDNFQILHIVRSTCMYLAHLWLARLTNKLTNEL